MTININELRDRAATFGSDYLTDEEWVEIIDRLEAAEKDIALKERVIDSLGSELNAVAKERDELRAKIAEMEQQEPVAIILNAPKLKRHAFLLEEGKKLPHKTKLYALPGAQPAPSIPEGWKLVPVDSTSEMDVAGSDHCDGYRSTAEAVWSAMIAAAPEAQP